jgi:hypothetical protein
MAIERINDLSAFKGFIEEKLSSWGTDLTLDQALLNWELENQTEEEREETLRAIRLGLDDMYAGRTVDAFEFVERMRQEFQSPAEPRGSASGSPQTRQPTLSNGLPPSPNARPR